MIECTAKIKASNNIVMEKDYTTIDHHNKIKHLLETTIKRQSFFFSCTANCIDRWPKKIL